MSMHLAKMSLLTIFLYAILFFLSFFILRLIFFKVSKTHNNPPSPLALPIIGHLHLLSPNIPRSFQKLSIHYGPLYRLWIGRQLCYVVSTPYLAKQFLKTHEHAFSSRRPSSAIKLFTHNATFAFCPIDTYWKFIRKICASELLSTLNLNYFKPLRALETKRFIQKLMNKAESGNVVNVSKEFLKLTSSMISQMMMSSRLSEREYDEITEVVREVTEILGTFDIADVIGFGGSFDFQGIKKRTMSTHKKYDALLEKFIKERKKLRNGRKLEQLKVEGGNCDEGKDLLDLMLDVMESETPDVKITEDNIKAVIFDIVSASTDTTAITLEWALAALTNNPRVLKKAQEEIDKVVGKKRLVEELDGPNLPYIQAIINETLRLYPAIPLIPRQSVEDCNVEGYDIPNGSLLLVSIWAIGRDPKYWESPLEFQPERFMNGDIQGPIDPKGHFFEFLPFGTGKRGCPGMNLALRELLLVLPTMIQCFQWKATDSNGAIVDRVDMTEKPGLSAPRLHNMTCLLEPRIDLSQMIRESSQP